MKIIKDTCYKGTRILLGNEKRNLLNLYIKILIDRGFEEISIPIIQFQSIFKDKVGDNRNLMFNFEDRAKRSICLAPEYTAIIQYLAQNYWKRNKDIRVFYIQECFRGEKPQAGRFRQFTQFGIEIINPKDEDATLNECIKLAMILCDRTLFYNKTESSCEEKFVLCEKTKRGLDYYKDKQGFEIFFKENQIVGGGKYEGGVGFALGIDRLMEFVKIT